MTRPLSDEVVARWLDRQRAQWRAAGLPEKIEDPWILDRVAAIVLPGLLRMEEERERQPPR